MSRRKGPQRRMKHIRDVLEPLGWKFDRIDGGSHIVVKHECGATCRIACTPSPSYEQSRNELTRLREALRKHKERIGIQCLELWAA